MALDAKKVLAILDGSKADLVDGKVPSSELPSYVDDVVEYANLAAFPATGETGKIYVALDTNKTYRWSGSTYIEIGSGTSNFNDLTNRPKYNGTLMTGSTDIPEANIFVATYGTTTAAEVAAALTAGKAVICEYTQNNIHCQMLLETESNSKYTFTEAGVATNDGVTSVYGYGAALNKTTNAWEVISGNGTIPSTAEQITYDSTLASHETGSVGAELASQSSQIDTLDNNFADEYDSTATYAVGDYCTHDRGLYECNTAISTAEAWTAAHWTACNVTDDVASWSGIFPRIEADTRVFAEDTTIWNASQSAYGTGTVADEFVRLDAAKTNKSELISDLLSQSATAAASMTAVDIVSTVPSSATDWGTKGQICVDTDYLYICVADSTWKRTALTTF